MTENSGKINITDFIKKYYSIIFFQKTNNPIMQFIRYAFVGGFAFLVDFGSFYFFTDILGVHYLISGIIAFIIGLLVNYGLSVFWVFNNRAMKNKLMEFVFFSIIGVIGLGLNELILWVLTDILLFYYLYSKLVSAFIVWLWNFFARKLLLFNKSDKELCQKQQLSLEQDRPG